MFFNGDKSHMLRDIVLTRDILSNKLSKLKVNKAPGVDVIVPRLLVENADIVNYPCCYICTRSLWIAAEYLMIGKKQMSQPILKRGINHRHVIKQTC